MSKILKENFRLLSFDELDNIKKEIQSYHNYEHITKYNCRKIDVEEALRYAIFSKKLLGSQHA